MAKPKKSQISSKPKPKKKAQVKIPKQTDIDEKTRKIKAFNEKFNPKKPDAPKVEKETLDEAIALKLGHHVFGTEHGAQTTKKVYKAVKENLKVHKVNGKTVPQHAEDYVRKKLKLKPQQI